MIPSFLTSATAMKVSANPNIAPLALGIGTGTIVGSLVGGYIDDSDEAAKIGGAIGGAVGGASTGGLAFGPLGALGVGAVGAYIGYECGEAFDDLKNNAIINSFDKLLDEIYDMGVSKHE